MILTNKNYNPFLKRDQINDSLDIAIESCIKLQNKIFEKLSEELVSDSLNLKDSAYIVQILTTSSKNLWELTTRNDKDLAYLGLRGELKIEKEKDSSQVTHKQYQLDFGSNTMVCVRETKVTDSNVKKIEDVINVFELKGS